MYPTFSIVTGLRRDFREKVPDNVQSGSSKWDREDVPQAYGDQVRRQSKRQEGKRRRRYLQVGNWLKLRLIFGLNIGTCQTFLRTVSESFCTTRYVKKGSGDNLVADTRCEKVPTKVCGRSKCRVAEGKEKCYEKVCILLYSLLYQNFTTLKPKFDIFNADFIIC